MSVQTHQSHPEVLNRRTLERDHRRLFEFLRPGMSVLDVGCGTGAITAGIARRVGPEGSVVGLDSDPSLLSLAAAEHARLPNLHFQAGDALQLEFNEAFDVVTAARVLQWVKYPNLALTNMARAARYNGRIIVLDYNHADNRWEPAPPREFTAFYYAFLDWRAANHWNNRIASDLPRLFAAEGLVDIHIHLDDETVTRLDPDFQRSTEIWAHVIDRLGPRMVESGHLEPALAETAADVYRLYVRNTLYRQTLALKTVTGRKI